MSTKKAAAVVAKRCYVCDGDRGRSTRPRRRRECPLRIFAEQCSTAESRRRLLLWETLTRHFHHNRSASSHNSGNTVHGQIYGHTQTYGDTLRRTAAGCKTIMSSITRQTKCFCPQLCITVTPTLPHRKKE